MAEFDIAIVGGTVVDPSQQLHAARDVGIKHGLVASVEAHIDPSRAARVVDASGKIVTAGLVDRMAHNCPMLTVLGVHPDQLAQLGVTTSVSPGDIGASFVTAFRAYAATQRARALAWLMISRVGYTPFPFSEVPNEGYLDQQSATAALIRNPDLLCGVKVRLSENVVGNLDLLPLTRALAASAAAEDATGKKFPLMVHIGGLRTKTMLADIVAALRPGDNITHAGVGYPNPEGLATGFAQDGAPIQAAYDAKTKGVGLDAGYSGSTDNVTLTILHAPLNRSGAGVRLDTLSSDYFSIAAGIGTATSLPDVMSAYLALNAPSNVNFHGAANINLPDFATLPNLSPAITLDDVVRMAATAPGAALADRVPLLGTLQHGAPGDVSVLEIVQGPCSFPDSQGLVVTGTQRLVPRQTIVGGATMM